MKKLFAILLLLGLTLNGVCQTYPSGFSQVTVVNGISNPSVMAFAPEGRIFIGEQGGNLRVVKNNQLLSTPFISLTVNSSGERGLIGVALDPDFTLNGYVYLYHTMPDGSRNRIIRVTANGDVAATGSMLTVLELDPLSAATNHNGGALHFGPDKKLYVAIGENALGSNAQNINTYHGKILRINPDGSVPEGNPFTTGSAQRLRTWALGVRNPYTMDFKPGTSTFYVNDVGQQLWEEINDATVGGLNFGWPADEGIETSTAFTNPIYAYGHAMNVDGQGCAITGGVFFNPSSTNYPAAYFGKYFFMDLCGRWINFISPETPLTRNPFATNISGQCLALDVGLDGNLYYLSRQSGALIRVVYNSSQQPTITDQPDNRELFPGESATFSISVSGAQPMTFQWRKNGANISGANASSYTIASIAAADAGTYSVVVTNSFGSVTSDGATLVVLGGNEAPSPTITTPAAGAQYRGGDIILFSGSATDPEDGTLAASALSWQIDFHHGTHVHDSPPINGVANGQFTVPTSGEVASDVFYRIYLTARDQQGRSTIVHRDVLPHTSQITLASEPSGLEVTLDGQPVATPHSVIGVEGIVRALGITSPQTLDGKEYDFSHWSNAGAAVQTISTPQNDVIYTAHFTENITSIEPGATSMVLYPNPASREIFFEQLPQCEIQIVELRGRVVQIYRNETFSRKVRIPINLNPGIYLVRIISSKGTERRKMVVEN